MASPTSGGCGCPPTTNPTPATGGVHHVFLTVSDLARARDFYTKLMPRLGYPAMQDFETVLGWISSGGSFWLKQADRQYAGDTFCKDRVGLAEVAFRAENREQVDALALDLPSWGGTILDQPRVYPEYVAGYYAVFFTDPDGIKLELVYIPAES
jgi:catechol 2,3-dioxygenase-like lactoylglutathione lyase family enzyme